MQCLSQDQQEERPGIDNTHIILNTYTASCISMRVWGKFEYYMHEKRSVLLCFTENNTVACVINNMTVLFTFFFISAD